MLIGSVIAISCRLKTGFTLLKEAVFIYKLQMSHLVRRLLVGLTPQFNFGFVADRIMMAVTEVQLMKRRF